MTEAPRHGARDCWRTPTLRDGRWYCEGYDCNFFPPEDEIVWVDPLGEVPFPKLGRRR